MPTHRLTARLRRLYKLHAFGIKFGLETEQALLESLGNPQQGLKIIHVAGTNGKGAVCACAESILRATGLRTGLYTSPHLIRVNERIRVNGACIPDDHLANLIDLVDDCAGQYAKRPGGRQITFFEFITALAFEYFRRQNVDVLVLETGMGGRLDATNTTVPQVSAITSIGLEHTAHLGTTLDTIAAEKAGIIKPNVPVILGDLPDEALRTIEKIARAKNARLIKATEAVTVKRQNQTIDGQKISIESSVASYGAVRLPLLGSCQLKNVGIALATLEEWCRINGTELSPEAVKNGLSSVSWPGRLQVILKNPVVIIDGAHNPEAAAELNKSLKELAGTRSVFLILGMCSDKDAACFIRNITVPVGKCWVVSLATERGISPAALARHAQGKSWQYSIATAPQALEEAIRMAREEDGIVCAVGSFYLAGEILALQEGAGGFVH